MALVVDGDAAVAGTVRNIHASCTLLNASMANVIGARPVLVTERVEFGTLLSVSPEAFLLIK